MMRRPAQAMIDPVSDVRDPRPVADRNPAPYGNPERLTRAVSGRRSRRTDDPTTPLDTSVKGPEALNTHGPPEPGVAHARGRIDVALRDGSTVSVRPVCADDEPGLLAFLRALSDQSRLLRFFSAGADLAGQARQFAQVDGELAYGLIATTGGTGEIVGHAGYVRESTDSAEVAFAIAEARQGRGLATVLLAHLATNAHEHGVSTFTAVVRPDNHRMIEVFRESGFPVEVHAGADVVSVALPTELGAAGWERFERRERIASVAAVDLVLAPHSVAVIGASRRRGTVGGEILHNILAGDFQGVIYPVNPSAASVQSLRAYPSIAELPEVPDLAVIAVPAAGVLEVARQCGAAGVRGLVVISAGFSEVGKEGARRERDLLEVCRSFGMRLVGPNCLGVLNTASSVQLNATFMPRAPRAGTVGFLSQSGGLGIAIVDAANQLQLGLSAFVSIGNKSDLSGNDFVQYWEQDPNTNVIVLYLESFGNARKFARIARRVAQTKPIVAVKSGRSAAGARATSSHTGALLAASDVTVDALFRQAGVIRTDTLGELFDVSALLSSQPPPCGNRVVILTNAGGPGILCADACATSGLEVVELPAQLRAGLRRFLPAEAGLGDPVDMIATASAADYRKAIEALARSGVADSIIVIFVPPLVTEAADVAAAISAAAEQIPDHVAIAAVFMADAAKPVALRRSGRPIPVYAFPEDAARAVGHAARYGAWRGAPAGQVPAFEDCRTEEAAAVIARALGSRVDWLDQPDVASVLDCYGLPTPPSRMVADAPAAARAAREIGGEVALKAIAKGLLHKSDAGGVQVSLRPGRVQRAAARMEETLGEAGFALDGFLVQAMAPPGVELIVGVVQDRAFGPLLACGAGGTSTELLGDVAVRLTPLTDLDAHDMLRTLKVFPLLDGYRGAVYCDVPGLEQLLLRVGALVEAHPEIAELDLNPVVALPGGPLILDARIRVEQCDTRSPLPSLVR
jgi:acetyl coenzyme A synthetase (ADP forming)-like protein